MDFDYCNKLRKVYVKRQTMILMINRTFQEKSSGDLKDLHKLTLLKNFDVHLTTSVGRVENTVFKF